MKHSLVILKRTIFVVLDKIADSSNNHGTRYKWYCACIEHINRAERDYFQTFPKLPKRSDFKSDVEFFKESARVAEALNPMFYQYHQAMIKENQNDSPYADMLSPLYK